jgi:hypothetical protein
LLHAEPHRRSSLPLRRQRPWSLPPCLPSGHLVHFSLSKTTMSL